MRKDSHPPLSSGELSRYSRHIMLPELGLAGQQKLKAASVLLVGAGGLGAPLGLYLTAAGVGTLGILDNDKVEDSNLQRQVIYTVDDLGQPKATCAAKRLAQLNPFVQIIPYTETLTSANALAIIKDYHLVIDGSDNFATRYLVNDACVLLGKPYIYGSVFRFEGQAGVFNDAGGPCYRCLFPEPPPPEMAPSCAEAGVLGVLPALIASIQATEAIKLITGIGESLSGRLLQYDALTMEFQTVRVGKDPACPLCGETPTLTGLSDSGPECKSQQSASSLYKMHPEELQRRLQQREPLVLIDVREPYEREICAIAGSISIPLQTLPEHKDQFSPEQTLIFYCKAGGRGGKACQLFREAGYNNAYNLSGGILAWADKVDPGMKRY